LEFHQHLGSLKHVINIIMWVRDMGCYSRQASKTRVEANFLARTARGEQRPIGSGTMVIIDTTPRGVVTPAMTAWKPSAEVLRQPRCALLHPAPVMCCRVSTGRGALPLQENKSTRSDGVVWRKRCCPTCGFVASPEVGLGATVSTMQTEYPCYML
jgi:hypothetical protein